MLTNFKPIERIETTEIKNLSDFRPLKNHKEDKFDLIEKFIANNPKISPVDASVPEVFSDYSIQENENLMTETLAHVYLEQKKFNKAITAFQILSLKYPEKSSFFAHQIEAIKELQKNN
jgi:UDP-N-acetylmuramyl pentapeptide synthase